MTLAELYTAAASGGAATMAAVLGFPVVIGLISLALKRAGHHQGSQAVANFGIAIGLAAVAVEILAILYATDRLGVDLVSDVSLFMLIGPAYLLIASVVVENIVHPGPQEAIRRRVRSVALILIVLAVLYFILGKLNLYMLVLTSMAGFLVFLAAIIAVLYYIVHRAL